MPPACCSRLHVRSPGALSGEWLCGDHAGPHLGEWQGSGDDSSMEVWVDSTELYSTFGSSAWDAMAGVRPGPHTLTDYIVNTAGAQR